MSELIAGAVYKDLFGNVLLAISDGERYNAVLIERDERTKSVEAGETILFTYVSAAKAFEDLRRPTKVADSLAEYYESKK